MDPFINDLAKDVFARRYGGARPGLCRATAEALLDDLLPVLIPALGNRNFSRPDDLAVQLRELFDRSIGLLKCLHSPDTELPFLEQKAKDWFVSFAQVGQDLDADAHYFHASDPAAHSVEEVMLAYPGFYAIAVYRLARELHRLDVPFLPRLFTEIAHGRTGIDIHPGATIGVPIFVDHGTGIVIGETTVIGKRVKLYQGVTLGALAVSKAKAKIKRHPTIEDDCVIYANATVLGGDTLVGSGAVVSGNVWLTTSVPAQATVYQKLDIDIRARSKSPEN